VSRGIPGRFREPVALVEASAFGVAGVVIALLGPWPWLALPAGLLIALVVLMIATWRPRAPKAPEPEKNLRALVHRWANQLADDDPARSHADEAVRLVDDIEELTMSCERRIAHLDGSAKDAAKDSLGKVTDFIAQSVVTYTGTNSAPVRATEWSALARRLYRGHQSLQEEFDSLVTGS
jgi:hypothetical protein